MTRVTVIQIKTNNREVGIAGKEIKGDARARGFDSDYNDHPLIQGTPVLFPQFFNAKIVCFVPFFPY